jgi:hypothetical protein
MITYKEEFKKKNLTFTNNTIELFDVNKIFNTFTRTFSFKKSKNLNLNDNNFKIYKERIESNLRLKTINYSYILNENESLLSPHKKTLELIILKSINENQEEEINFYYIESAILNLYFETNNVTFYNHKLEPKNEFSRNVEDISKEYLLFNVDNIIKNLYYSSSITNSLNLLKILFIIINKGKISENIFKKTTNNNYFISRNLINKLGVNLDYFNYKIFKLNDIEIRNFNFYEILFKEINIDSLILENSFDNYFSEYFGDIDLIRTFLTKLTGNLFKNNITQDNIYNIYPNLLFLTSVIENNNEFSDFIISYKLQRTRDRLSNSIIFDNYFADNISPTLTSNIKIKDKKNENKMEKEHHEKYLNRKKELKYITIYDYRQDCNGLFIKKSENFKGKSLLLIKNNNKNKIIYSSDFDKVNNKNIYKDFCKFKVNSIEDSIDFFGLKIIKKSLLNKEVKIVNFIETYFSKKKNEFVDVVEIEYKGRNIKFLESDIEFIFPEINFKEKINRKILKNHLVVCKRNNENQKLIKNNLYFVNNITIDKSNYKNSKVEILDSNSGKKIISKLKNFKLTEYSLKLTKELNNNNNNNNNIPF